MGGHQAGDGLQLVFAAFVVPLGQAGHLARLDQLQHLLLPGGALGRVQGVDGQNAALGHDAGDLSAVQLDGCQSHTACSFPGRSWAARPCSLSYHSRPAGAMELPVRLLFPQGGHGLLQPPAALHNALIAGGEGHAQIALPAGAEHVPGHQGDLGLLQEILGQLR